jgi:hypothetical protein
MDVVGLDLPVEEAEVELEVRDHVHMEELEQDPA